MQQRMKEFTMNDEAVSALLSRAKVGHLSTIGKAGFPYTVALHFVFEGGAFYFHCLPKGEKLDNIERSPNVCFEVDEMKGIVAQKSEEPCGADTIYESVIAIGKAEVLNDGEEKKRILHSIVDKYTPGFRGAEMAESKIKGTAVVKISILHMTGKYHK